MATLSRGQSFGATETITNTKLHNLVDLGTVTNIVDADISASAGIQFSKILASTLDASLLGSLGNIQSGAGKIPNANLNLPFGSTISTLCSIPNLSLLPLTLASWVDGASMRNFQSLPTLAGQAAWYSIVSSLASGGFPSFNGTDKFVGRKNQSTQVAFSSYMSVGFSLTTSYQKCAFDTKDYDTSSNYDSATNYRFTAPITGKYLFCVGARLSNLAGVATAAIYKNGSIYKEIAVGACVDIGGGNFSGGTQGSFAVALNSSDYVEVFAKSNTGTTLQFGASTFSYFTGTLLFDSSLL